MYTLAEAARASGKSKSTILRAVKSGKLSADKDAHGQYRVAPVELHRVYPSAPSEAVHAPLHEAPNDAPRTTHDAVAELAVLHAELAAARSTIEDREKELHHRDRTIDDLRARLDAEGEERRKLTAMLTDQRPAPPRGFWARLRGH